MSITNTYLNSSLETRLNNLAVGSNVEKETITMQDVTSGVKSTLAGAVVGEVVSGVISYGTKENAEQTSYVGITDAIGITGINDPENIILSKSTPDVYNGAGLQVTVTQSGVDSDGNPTYDVNTEMDPAIAGAVDSAGDFIFSSISSIGGSLDSTLNSIISILTGLGTGGNLLPDVAEGGSALDAIKSSTDKLVSEVNAKANDIVASANEAVAGISGAVTGAGNTLGDTGQLSGQITELKAPDSKELVEKLSAINTLNPEAEITDAVSDATGNSNLSSQFKQAKNAITKGINDISAALTDVAAIANDFEKAADEFISNTINTTIKTGQGLLQDIAESLSRTATQIIAKLAPGVELTDDDISNIIQDVQSGDEKKVAEAIKKVTADAGSTGPEMKKVLKDIDPVNTQDYINKMKAKATAAGIPKEEIDATAQRITDIDESFSNIDTTISGTLVKSALSYAVTDTRLAENAERYAGSQTQFNAFTYVDSKEELGAEIRSIKRPVVELIVHASETYTNQNLGAEEIHIDHNERGLQGIQYHYVIRRDGRLQRGLPLARKAEASAIRGHDLRCIDVVLVGGLNCPTETENPLSYRSAQSYTMAQMRTLEALLEAFYRRFPGGQVFGHNDLEDTAADPYFDVIEYAAKVFRKKSVYNDLLVDQVLNPAELNKRSPK